MRLPACDAAQREENAVLCGQVGVGVPELGQETLHHRCVALDERRHVCLPLLHLVSRARSLRDDLHKLYDSAGMIVAVGGGRNCPRPCWAELRPPVCHAGHIRAARGAASRLRSPIGHHRALGRRCDQTMSTSRLAAASLLAAGAPAAPFVAAGSSSACRAFRVAALQRGAGRQTYTRRGGAAAATLADTMFASLKRALGGVQVRLCCSKRVKRMLRRSDATPQQQRLSPPPRLATTCRLGPRLWARRLRRRRRCSWTRRPRGRSCRRWWRPSRRRWMRCRRRWRRCAAIGGAVQWAVRRAAEQEAAGLPSRFPLLGFGLLPALVRVGRRRPGRPAQVQH